MFKKIRNKITFFNTVILIAFLILFIFVVIMILRWSMIRSGEIYLKRAAEQIETSTERSEERNILIPTFHNELGYSYLVWDRDLGIVEQNINDKGLIEESYRLINEHEPDNAYYSVTTDEKTYRIYKDSYLNKSETLFVFQNITPERELLSYFVTYLLLFGFLGILLLIPISFILAGRSLVSVKESYETQKTFIADASHELRSPLNVIQTSVDVLSLKGNETIKSNMNWINNISVECENMATLINDLTDISKAENSELAYANRNINVSELADEVVFLLTQPANDKKIKIVDDIEPDLRIIADSDKIRQLIRIILDNAIKYSPEDSTVKISLKEEKNQIILKVVDAGIGISKKDLNKIFDRFYRCDNARSRQVSGTGLGLNIAQTIVDYYKGKINVKSQVGEGSEFKVILPASNI